MSGTHKGYLLEFPTIRVDRFTQDISDVRVRPSSSSPQPRWVQPPAAQLYLLTHIHTDHLTGLSSKTFNGLILCSRATKAMLLRLQTEKSRRALNAGEIDRPRYKYANLWPRQGGGEQTIEEKRRTKRKRGEGQWVDIVRTLEYDQPEMFHTGKETVTITMLDANHCPGSSMFLIQNATTAVLHTGDLRCDAPFIGRLRHHPAVKPFVREWRGIFDRPEEGEGAGEQELGLASQPRLERLYLDTAMFLGTGDVPSRVDAIDSLIQTMRKYPADTHWFFECFTWGYEEVLKAVHCEFGEKIYVDSYKRVIFALHRELDPDLAALYIDDPSTRFHACELRAPCSTCRARRSDGSLVVRVSFPEVKLAEFDVRHGMVMREVEAARRGEGAWPTKLLCPAARHSPLPELQNLVRLFRPRNLSPNALLHDVSLGASSEPTIPVRGADYYAMVSLFEGCLGPGGRERLRAEAIEYGKRFGLDTAEQVEDNFRAVFGVPERQISAEVLDHLDVNLDHVSLEGYGSGALLEQAGVKNEEETPLQHLTGQDRRSNRTLYAQAAMGELQGRSSPHQRQLSPRSISVTRVKSESPSTASPDNSLATMERPYRRVVPAASTTTSSSPRTNHKASPTPTESTQSTRYQASQATIAILSRRRQERREASASAARA